MAAWSGVRWGAHVVPRAASFLLGLCCVLLLLEAGLWLLAEVHERWAAAPAAGASPRAFTILCLGDSFTEGVGAPEEMSYPRQLERLLQRKFGAGAYRVINEGRLGYNTRMVLERVDREHLLERYRPQLVLLLLGGANSWNLEGYERDVGPLRLSLLEGLQRTSRALRLAALMLERLQHQWRDARERETLVDFQARIERDPLEGCQRYLQIYARPGAAPLRFSVEEAMAWLASRRRAAPLDERYPYGEIELLWRLRQRAKAQHAVEQALRAFPDKGLIYFIAAQVHKKGAAGRRLAETYHRTGVSLDPGFGPNYFALAQLAATASTCRANPAQINEAISWLVRGMAASPACKPAGRAMIELLRADMMRSPLLRTWVRTDLVQLLRRSRRAGARVALQTYPSNSRNVPRVRHFHRVVAEVVAEIAAREPVILVRHQRRFHALSRMGEPEEAYFAPDIEHPNGRGYGVMAETIYQALAEAGVWAATAPAGPP